MKTVFLPIAYILCFFFTNADAALLIRDYEKYKNTDFINFYLLGLGDGADIVESARDPKAKKLFCLPRNMNLNAENYANIIEDQMKKRQYAPEFPVSAVLVEGLMRTFPCKGS